MLKCLIALTSLLSTGAVAVPAWTWVDEQGRRHYSDVPIDGATQIELGEPSTFGGETSNRATIQLAPAQQDPAAFTYTILDVISPSSQETVFNIEGILTVELATSPPLQSDHRIDAILDGEYLAIGSRSLTIPIPEVFRGEHTLRAVIVSANGEELMRSTPVTFFVRQNSILTPRPQSVPPP